MSSTSTVCGEFAEPVSPDPGVEAYLRVKKSCDAPVLPSTPTMVDPAPDEIPVFTP